jgi:hypothetical protein
MPGCQGDVFFESAQLSFVSRVLGYLGCAFIVNGGASAVPDGVYFLNPAECGRALNA